MAHPVTGSSIPPVTTMESAINRHDDFLPQGENPDWYTTLFVSLPGLVAGFSSKKHNAG